MAYYFCTNAQFQNRLAKHYFACPAFSDYNSSANSPISRLSGAQKKKISTLQLPPCFYGAHTQKKKASFWWLLLEGIKMAKGLDDEQHDTEEDRQIVEFIHRDDSYIFLYKENTMLILGCNREETVNKECYTLNVWCDAIIKCYKGKNELKGDRHLLECICALIIFCFCYYSGGK